MWHPPESRPPVSFKPEEPGWTQGADGLWYPPNHPTSTSSPREPLLARPPEPGWWQANDGWWYPPESRPGAWGSAPAEFRASPAGPPLVAATPIAGAGAAATRWRSLRGLATALTVLLWIEVALNALLVIALVNQRVVFEDLRSTAFGVDPDRVDTADGLVGGASALELALRVAIAVVFIIWFWRAAKNNEALERLGARLGPGWAIGGWFIPLASLVIPLLIAQNLWKGADPVTPRGDASWRSAPGSSLIGWWWALWVAAAIAAAVASVFGPSVIDSDASDFRAANMWMIAASIAFTGAAVLAIYVVRELSARQEHCLAAQQRAWATGHPE
jgi:hypothetical protein